VAGNDYGPPNLPPSPSPYVAETVVAANLEAAVLFFFINNINKEKQKDQRRY